MKPTNSIVEKIQKLLSLANSDNENEAKIATNKANELLIKYNLSLQEVQDTQFEYGEREVLKAGLLVKDYQKMISGLMDQFFFVKVAVFSRPSGYTSGIRNGVGKRVFERTIILMGTDENTKIASYVFTYLNQVYPKLWLDYKKDKGLQTWSRTSYYTGLTSGIAKMLEDTKWRVQKETGLVVIRDPGLEKFCASKSAGSYHGRTGKEIDPNAYMAGVQDGLTIKLRKPLGETQKTSLALAGKRQK